MLVKKDIGSEETRKYGKLGWEERKMIVGNTI